MPIIKSFAPKLNLTNYQTFLVDDDPNSTYFRITEFQETFTGGKNGFLIEGSSFLKPTTEIKIELLDVAGNPIYFEPGDGIPEYYEGLSKLISVHVYDDTPIGLGKITILGELSQYIDNTGIIRDVPSEWKGVYNVKWERVFQVNKNLSNETIVRFVKRPVIQIDEIVKPIFTKDIPQITQTGTASGVGENPGEGTSLTGYRAGTLYRIAITDTSNFTSSIDENVISFPSLGYSATVKEVLNNKEVLVDTPYTVNSIVTNFQNQSYTSTYEYPAGAITEESALTGSFAKVNISNLKTFVGDVARVKVYRKSRNEVGDFQLVQDSRLESVELLRDITITSDTELNYGVLQPSTFQDYWITSSNHPTEFDDTYLFASLKSDYDTGTGGTFTLLTSQSFNISDNVEYNLSFKTRLSGSVSPTKTISAFLTGSYSSSVNGNPVLVQYRQNFISRSVDNTYLQRKNISENIISNFSGSARLGFEFVGDDWYVANISLKNAQETSFSPDEFTLIQEVPRKLPKETFDFRFEFYDINNNFIPVEVTATKEFTGGNTSDTSTLTKFLNFESDRTAFRFTTGSLGNPEFQQIAFKVSSNLLTGSVTYTSQAFDFTGSLLTSESYDGGQYPGFLTNASTAGATLTIANFTGSRNDVIVGSIVYTASREDFQEFETVYRFEDGENAPNLFATSNANQFIYEPTTISPKPSGQEIRIQVKRKNLASLITPITANSSSDAPLTVVDDVNGIKTFSISATQFSQSLFVGQNGPYQDVTYSFTASDEFNNPFSDEITISPVINFDGISVVLSNENTSFRANSLGTVTSTEFDEGDGFVTVNIGNESISHNNGLSQRNTFDITSVTPTANITPNSFTPSTNSYGISAMSVDSGSIDINISYKAGDNFTTQSFVKKVNYTKNRIAAPVISIQTTNKNQTVSAYSTGVQTGTFSNAFVTVNETYLGNTNSKTITSLTAVRQDTLANLTTNPSTGEITLSGQTLATGVDSTTVLVTATVTDTEGSSRTVIDNISLSKAKNAPPNVEIAVRPSSQTIEANSRGSGSAVPQSLTITATEGGVDKFVSLGTPSFTNGLAGSASTNTITFTNTASDMTSDTGTVSIPVNYTDSEGTSGQKITIATVSRVRRAQPSVTVTATPQAQSVNSKSTGEVISTPQDVVIKAYQGNTELTYDVTLSSNSTYNVTGQTLGSRINNTISISSAQVTSDTVTGTVTVGYKDEEGTIGSRTIEYTVSKSKAAVPTILITATPQAQSVLADQFGVQTGTLSNVTVDAIEGSTSQFDSMSITSTSGFSTAPTVSSNTLVMTSAVMNSDEGSVTLTVNYTDSEGTSSSGSITIRTTKVSVGLDGSNGGDGNDAKVVSLTANRYVIPYDGDGNESGSNSITLTATEQNHEGTVYYEFLQGVTQKQNTTANTYAVDEAEEPAPGTSDLWTVKTREGSSGGTVIAFDTIDLFGVKDGTNARSIRLSSDYQSFVEAKDGTITPSTITFTASRQNISTATTFTPTPSVTLGGSGDVRTLSSTNFGSNTSVTINASSEGFEDEITIVRLVEGSDAVNVISTNQSHTAPSDFDGTNTDLTNSGTTIKVFEGTTELSYDGVGTSAGKWTVATTVSPAGKITVGSITDNGDNITVGDHSNMANDTDVVLVIYEITGQKLNGDSFSINSNQTITKSKAGKNAITAFLTNEAHVLPTTNTGETNYAGSGTSIIVYKGATQLEGILTQTPTTNQFSASAEVTLGEITIGNATTSSNEIIFATHSLMNTDLAIIKYTINIENEIFLEKFQTLTKVREGSDSKVVTLSANRYTIPYDGDGNEDGELTIVLTATQQNHVGTVYYEFRRSTDGGSTFTQVQNTTTNTYTIPDASEPGPGENHVYQVRTREGSDTGTVVTFDNIDVFGIKEGSDAFTVFLTNDSHTFPGNNDGSVNSGDLAAGATQIRVFRGTTQYTFDDGGTPADNTYTIGTVSQSGITVSASTVLNQRQFTPTAVSATKGSVAYEIIDNETSTTFNKIYTFGVSVKGDTGEDSQTITLSADAQAFRVAQNGSITPDSIKLSVNKQNLTDTTNWTTSPSVTLYTAPTGGSTTTTGDTVYLRKGDFGSNTSVLVTATAGTFSDSTTIVRLEEGSDAINVINTNQAHTLPAASDGTVSSYDNSGTTIKVFEGDTELAYDGVGTSNGTWTVSISQNPTSTITVGSITDNGNNITIGNHSNMAIGTSSVLITYSISGKRQNGTSFSIDTTQTITKSIAGTDGVNGSNGTDAKTVALSASPQYTVLYDGDGTKTAVAITLTATPQNFTNPYYQFTQDGTERQAYSTTATYLIPDAQEPAANTSDLWQVNVKEGNVGSVVAFDNTDIFGVKAGTNAITAFLTNEAHTLPTTNAGVVTYTGSGTSVVVLKGATELNGITSGTPTLGQFTVTTAVTTGTITVGAKSSPGNPMVFGDHTNMTTDLAIIEYTINVENLVTLKKYQTLAKSIEGDKGDPGDTGPSGLRTTSGMVHYQLVSTSAPSSPTATSFNFSTGGFTGLTANWGTGAPTYASGNTNKYWYATYTVVESSAGSGVGTPTFGTVTQAIGFSGLVSFTAAENITDGTNTLSFGVSGATLINGDNISTGRIISTNYVTGSGNGFTNTGTEFNLDEGLIASKNFTIKPNGDAVFNGSGTFSGTVNASGGSFTNTVSIGSGATSGTLTVGTDTNKITIIGTNSEDTTKIYSGTGTYGNSNTGFYLGADGLFSLGNKLTFDASSNLTISGNITATTLTATTSGNIGGWSINNGYLEKDGVRLNAGSNNGYLGIGLTSYNSGSGIWIGETSSALYQMSIKNTTTNKYILWDGSNLQINAGNFSLNSDGDITASNVQFNDGTFSGTVYATDGIFSGSITATGGTIGGYTIGDNILTSTTGKIEIGKNEIQIYDNNNLLKFDVNTETSLPNPNLNDSGTTSGNSSNALSIQRTTNGVTSTTATSNMGIFTAGVTSTYIVSYSFPGGTVGTNHYVRAAGSETVSTLEFRLRVVVGASTYTTPYHSVFVAGSSTKSPSDPNLRRAVENQAALTAKVFSLSVPMTSGNIATVYLDKVGTIEINNYENYEIPYTPTGNVDSTLDAAASYTGGATSTIINGGGFLAKTGVSNWFRVRSKPTTGQTVDVIGGLGIGGENVTGNIGEDGIFLKFYEKTAGANQWIMHNSGSSNWLFGNSDLLFFSTGTKPSTSSPQAAIDTGGNFRISGNTAYKNTGTTWSNPSDERIKSNIIEITGSLDKINELHPIEFTWKEDYAHSHSLDINEKQYGFTAQNMEQVFPNEVITTSYKIDDTDVGMKTISYHTLNVYLVKAVQELSNEINNLKDEINTLKNKT
jgi:hypothetical protein